MRRCIAHACSCIFQILADFTNAILTEPRIFRLDQGALQWLNAYETLRTGLFSSRFRNFSRHAGRNKGRKSIPSVARCTSRDDQDGSFDEAAYGRLGRSACCARDYCSVQLLLESPPSAD